MITSRFAILLAQKAHREGRKLTYETVVQETGLSKAVLVRLNAQEFSAGGHRVSLDTLDTLCGYLGCGVGDILEYASGEKTE